jgi:hypothetical protein
VAAGDPVFAQGLAMGVKGDLAAALTTKGMTHDEARELLNFILDHADDPNFAYKYADQEYERESPHHNEVMLDYWSVIRFLKSTV